MLQFLRTPAAQAVIWGAVLLVMIMVGYYLVRRFRDRTGDDTPTTNDWITNFREIHDKGDITGTEFRSIKSVLGAQLQEELRDSGDEA